MENEPEVPKLPDVFQVVKKAGEGSFGTVWYVLMMLVTGVKYAVVKVLDRNTTGNSDIDEERRDREIGFLRALSDVAGVVGMIGCCESVSTPAIVLEATNCTLKDVMDAWREPFPVWFVIYVAREVMKTLGIMHSRRIIHCDIKPSNIHFGRDVHEIVQLLQVFLFCSSPAFPSLLSRFFLSIYPFLLTFARTCILYCGHFTT
jgi:serine/threonine protein kinase